MSEAKRNGDPRHKVEARGNMTATQPDLSVRHLETYSSSKGARKRQRAGSGLGAARWRGAFPILGKEPAQTSYPTLFRIIPFRLFNYRSLISIKKGPGDP
ncbi:hypothetical protein NDU88_007199 [Pleurodeles waltl]|uniref:Uncharacterized protein n=1 Tax=Pleurodeles waltl TaxID=8319 RepID=A0AAV7VRY0_PLEWA|nr:hypothetical protein NDU88_007199 [Pleurodeles waltl]